MVVQKAINNLKEGPKEDKVVVASGIAISVVVILLVAWAIIFFHNIQKGTQQLNLSAGAQDQFNPANVTQAQQQLQQSFTNSTDQFTQIRNESSAGQDNTQQSVQMQTAGQGSDQFGTPNSGY